MTDSEKIAEWTRFYEAAVPSYKAHALLAVFQNNPELFAKVVEKLKLTLLKLMKDMEEDRI